MNGVSSNHLLVSSHTYGSSDIPSRPHSRNSKRNQPHNKQKHNNNNNHDNNKHHDGKHKSRKSKKKDKEKNNNNHLQESPSSQLTDPYFIMHENKRRQNEAQVKAFDIEVEGDGRFVYCNQPQRNATFDYISNTIKTSKYTLITFIPKNLYEQFRRLANFYFLIIALLQALPIGFSPTNPYSSLVPLIIVLGVSAVKEAYEDWKRHQSDISINNSRVNVLRGGKFQIMAWKDIVVGDIVKIVANEGFPADLIVLNSSEHQGICYVDTCNLDGETNLKLHQALPETCYLRHEGDYSNFKAVVKCEQPNNRLYNFSGWINMQGEENKLSLDVKQLLLRGCVLKNTAWICGLVIYTGNDSKLMQNATKPPSKRTRMDKVTNRALLRIFAFMMVVCLVGAFGSGVWTKLYGDDHWYLEIDKGAALSGFLNFFSFLICFSVMIPISLYVSLEMVKVSQALFIGTDLQMYYDEKDTPAKARTSNLSEELGQVQYIFSDKTGTLTRNQMEFFKCTIGGISYGNGLTEIAITKAKRDNKPLAKPDPTPLPGADATFTFNDRRLLEHMNGHSNSENIREFFTLLSVCHTVIPEKDEKDPSILRYQASSPDEGALVYAAKNVGFFFHTRNPKDIECTLLGAEHRFEILNVLEFNSTRKRMSIIFRDKKGNIKLYCKGADSVILERLRPGQDKLVEATIAHLEEYASDGLRTLCLAYADLEEDEYARWNEIFHAASIALVDRSQQLDNAAELIEKDLILLGGTAIEDKLQVGVSDAIFTLIKANIKLWVLTGDKQETAINIGYACSLLTKDMTVIILSAHTYPETEALINRYLDDIKSGVEYGLVIDGATLTFALEGFAKLKFLNLARKCTAVICCRVSPLQKAQVVLLVKENVRACTLAIGDGANDVSMIQQAHIGVGISGQEGMQAVMSSDYAIAQFRFLERLVLIHGRYSYKRVAKLILYCLYKNMVFSFVQFPFMWYNGFSGQTMYDGWSLTIYNIVFTALPIIFYSIFDKDVKEGSMQAYPQLYETGHENHEFTIGLLAYWLLTGVFQAVIIYFGCHVVWGSGDGAISEFAQGEGLWSFGALCYICVVAVVTVRLAIEVRHWNGIVAFFLWGCCLIWILWAIALSSLKYFLTDGNMYYVAHELFESGIFWLSILAITVAANVPSFCWEYYRRNYDPHNFHIIQEMENSKNPETRGLLSVKLTNSDTDYSASADASPPYMAQAHIPLTITSNNNSNGTHVV